jgi:hypothetical protein
MTPEEASTEALRRILVAKETGAVELDLSGLKDGKPAQWRTPDLQGMRQSARLFS